MGDNGQTGRWLIKKKSSTGKRVERIYDTTSNKWREQKSYSDGEFRADAETARALRDKLLETARNIEWLKLYERL